MEDLEDSGELKTGAGVIIYTDDDKRYLGFLQGYGDNYLYLKATHEWGEIKAEVTPDSRVRLREMLTRRPTWKLKLSYLAKYHAVPVLGREEMVDALAEWMEEEAIDSIGVQHTFLPKAKAVSMAIPHMNVDRFESLQDVLSGSVLAGLDFSTEEAYNDVYGKDSDDSEGHEGPS